MAQAGDISGKCGAMNSKGGQKPELGHSSAMSVAGRTPLNAAMADPEKKKALLLAISSVAMAVGVVTKKRKDFSVLISHPLVIDTIKAPAIDDLSKYAARKLNLRVGMKKRRVVRVSVEAVEKDRKLFGGLQRRYRFVCQALQICLQIGS